MKKLLLCVLFVAALKPVNAQLQLLSNGDFENWISVNFNDPQHWANPNIYSLSIPDTPVIKTTGVSGNAVRLNNGTFMWAFISNSWGNAQAGEGGEAYTQQPTGVSIVARHNILSGDTARIFIMFKNSGAIIMDDTFSIAGNASSFTTLNFSFSQPFPYAPDSVVVFITSGDPFSSIPGGGGYLEIDQITFTGATQQLINSGFNNWSVVTREEPNFWMPQDSISKTTDKFSGNYAARMPNYFDGASYLASELGVPFFNLPETYVLRGRYKYTTPGADTASIKLSMVGLRNDSMDVQIHTILHLLPPVNSYTYFEIPIKSDSLRSPLDTILIQFRSSTEEIVTAVGGSALYLDSLALVNKAPTNVAAIQSNTEKLVLYPNPVNDVLHVMIQENKSESWTLSILDINGKELERLHGNGEKIALPTKHLSRGVYFCEVKKPSGVARNTFIKN